MTPDGILVESTAAAHWAWVGLRLCPAPIPPDSRVYLDVEESQLRAERARAEQAWLGALWTTEHGARWELRHTSARPREPVLLGRVHGRDRATVVAAALALRDRLAGTPSHVLAEPILDADQLGACLKPAPPGPGSRIEVRKRLNWAWCGRQDTNRRVCFAVSPLVAGSGSWELVWDAMGRQPSPTTVGVYLEPYQPSVALGQGLRALAVEYAQLAAHGRQSPVWNVSRPPEPFAVTAAPGYADAGRRYAGRCYRLRISVTAEGPIGPGFAELLAATVGDAAACRVAEADADRAWLNLATMDRGWLDETYRQGAPAGTLNDVERILCDLADETEAGAVFRLPQAGARHPGGPEDAVPLAATPLAGPARTEVAVARKRIFVSYVREDLERVDALVLSLRQAGYDIWIDRSELRPGRRWQTEIRRSIENVDYFLACFSPRYWKNQSFMNEELILAVERFRQMPRTRDWFIPAMLEECELPDHSFGAGETLAGAMQYADFGTDWDAALRQVIAVLGPPEKN